MESKLTPSQQQFVVSHLKDGDFKVGGLRDYSAYRDLGVAEGDRRKWLCFLHDRPLPSRAQRARHHHSVQFQMVYCLKGWFETEFEGAGRHRLVAGSSWVQPPGIRHTVVGWSDDCE